MSSGSAQKAGPSGLFPSAYAMDAPFFTRK